MIPVTGATLLAVAPRFASPWAERQRAICEAIGDRLAPLLSQYHISTPLRIAHFIGQTCHESAGFRTTEEFASGADYEGRRDLGNVVPGDGVRYKGRGLMQLTGRANYRRLGDLLNLPLEAQPEMAAAPLLSVEIACVYWRDRSINAAADRDDIHSVTMRINGGYNGLSDRLHYTTRAKAEIARLPDFSDVVAGVTR